MTLINDVRMVKDKKCLLSVTNEGHRCRTEAALDGEKNTLVTQRTRQVLTLMSLFAALRLFCRATFYVYVQELLRHTTLYVF